MAALSARFPFELQELQAGMSFFWLSEIAESFMRAEADRSYPNETGGVLIGYVADNAQPVIVAAIGPGPNAHHSPNRFQPDHAWQCAQLEEIYNNSDGLHTYLGDWHTHPNSSPNMSWLDRRTIRAIAKHSPAMCTHPLMLIGGGSPDKWQWLAHRYIGFRMLGMLIDCSTNELHFFKS